tara:strand:+ start:911 stop:2098 length:1188 start_codon:yes stop_codon:yes gene_type:complete
MIILEDFCLSKKNINIINKWKKSFINKKNIKPLIINGIKGSGKTTLANILLDEYSVITIDSNTNNVVEYIKNIITKKDISMLFNKNKKKSIIFDDIFINNKIIKEFMSYSYLLYNNNNPIIIINSYNIEKITNIKDKYYIIDIHFSNNELFNITKTICNNYNMKIKNNDIKNIISKSNNNLNSIKENIEYLKYSDNYNIDSYDNNNYNNTITKITEDLIYNDIHLNSNDITNKYSSDNNIILYNIIDNIYNLTNDIDIIIKLYKSILYIDICDYYYYQSKYSNIYIFYNTVYPISIIKKNKLNKTSIVYNKYISYSLQYINSINNYIVSTDIYYYFVKIFISFNKDKNILIDLKYYIKYYNLSKKNINSIIKLYFLLNNKKHKSYTNIINNLFKK